MCTNAPYFPGLPAPPGYKVGLLVPESSPAATLPSGGRGGRGRGGGRSGEGGGELRGELRLPVVRGGGELLLPGELEDGGERVLVPCDAGEWCSLGASDDGSHRRNGSGTNATSNTRICPASTYCPDPSILVPVGKGKAQDRQRRGKAKALASE
jgi:hypothetical protein